MPISTKLTELATKPLPKFISPGAHAVIDWATAGAFITSGALLWKKNKRAALGSFLCGNLIGSLIFLTDCPGGVWKKISFETHGKIDPGVAEFCRTVVAQPVAIAVIDGCHECLALVDP